MNTKKSILRRLIPWLITAILLFCLVYFVGIPLYSQKEEQVARLPEVSYYEGGKDPVVLENDALRFELDPATTHFKLTEKANGREWLSNPEGAANDAVAKNSQANLYALQSTLLMTYTDKDKGTANINYNNYQRSIMNGNYTIENVTADSVDVVYSIGDISKVYMMPYAITEERFLMYTDRMKDQLGLSKSKINSKVGNLYIVYSPETLAAKSDDDREAVLAQYPIAAEQPIRVLDTSKKADYQSVSDYFVQVGYNQEEFDLDQQLIASASASQKPVFNVTLRYRLEGADFVVEVPYDEIRYRNSFPITTITVLPMFGAAGASDEGFMFVPEGGGALINFNNGKLSQNSYYANMYGWDYATYRGEVVNETKNTFPVFGMARNGGSFICMMEGASSYGGILADISMRYNSFNWVCARYTVLHGDQYNVSDKTGSKVYMFEKQIPSDTVRQRYRFVDSGSYADMASAYGDYLRETNPELKNASLDADLPVSVELVGAIDKTVVKFGMPVDSVVPTTTFAQATDIIRELKRGDVKNLSVRVTGWSNGGVNQKVLTSVKVLNELGGDKGMELLVNDAKNIGVNLYFDGISCFAYDSGLLEGFIPFRDAARYTTREQVSIIPYSPIIYKADTDQDPFYLVQPKFAQKCTDNLIAALAAKKAYGVAFRDIGNLLSADYYVNGMTTREQVKQMNIDSLKQARDAGEAVMIKEGYDYAMPYADLITDMDLDGVEYSILDASVPFYQIAIHGAVNYTGKPINLANDWRTDLLRCMEYGAGLNFTFMAESGWVLQDSFHTTYYGASYDAWKETAAEIIAACQADLKGLNSLRITDHQTVDTDIRLTVYENGTKVYVNYGAEDYQAGGVLIPARGYVVEGGERE